MSLLDLDTTLNKYLEIINKQVLEPYIISKSVPTISDPNIVANSQINEDVLSIKYNATTENTAILKIKQTVDGNNNVAEFTHNLLSTQVIINSDNKASDLYTDDDGLIYYLYDDKRHYDLSTLSSAISSLPTSITDYTYFDYFVRFKVLGYIKENHTNVKFDNLADNVNANIGNIVNDIQTVNNTKYNEMLKFLNHINENNFNKFKATVDCLYYYYYIALLEYNNKFCEDNFIKYGVNEFSNGGQLHTSINEINTLSVSATDISFTGSLTTTDNKKVTNILIAIFECLLRANQEYGDDKISSILNNENSTVRTLIKHLAKLCNLGGNDMKLGLKQDTTDLGSGTITVEKSLKLDKTNNNENTYTNLLSSDTFDTIINDLTPKRLLFKIQDKIQDSISNDNTILSKSEEFKTIKTIYDFIGSLNNTPFLNAINSDLTTSIAGNDSNFQGNNGSSIDYITYINNSLTNLHTALGEIIEGYDKAVKLNSIQATINKQFDDISTVVTNEPIYTNDSISKNLIAISSYNKAYKENVDQYKIKNVELDNIVKSNLYNNIFLYVTIVVLILICLGMIFINNNKQSLKTQYAVIVITFLLLYYIIYTNISINVTEQFFEESTRVTPKTTAVIKDISDYVYVYLINLVGSNAAYKASLDKEKKKYNTFAKSSNTKLTNLKMALNDEFINAAKSKELVKFLLLFTFIAIVTYIVYINVDDLITTAITFIVLFVIILCIYFYNTNLMTRVIHSSKYWNHQMIKK